MRLQIAGGVKSWTWPQTRALRKMKSGPLTTWLFAAGCGLVVWILYLAADKDTLARVALAVVALPGFTTFAIWLRRRHGRGGAGGSDAGRGQLLMPRTPRRSL